MKHINQYWDDYQENYSFEETLRIYREKKALEFVESMNPSSLLEIGCGFTPIFEKYNKFDSCTIIEPGERAFKNALEKSISDSRLTCINSFLENSQQLEGKKFDCIVSTGVLHETETPDTFLRVIRSLMHESTKVYINVPNSDSFHRVLAREMGLIKSVQDRSDRNILLKQSSIFNMDSLKQLIVDTIPDVKIDACKTFFIKPFTHQQMVDLWSQYLNKNHRGLI